MNDFTKALPPVDISYMGKRSKQRFSNQLALYLSNGGQWHPWHDHFLADNEKRLVAVDWAYFDLPQSKTLHESQKQVLTFERKIKMWGKNHIIRANIRYDDTCGNGHNTFAITGEIENPRITVNDPIVMGGCIHDEIGRYFPKLRPLIQWHLVSSDEPMYYISNTLYHAKNRDWDYARNSAVWPEATEAQLSSKETLLARLPRLMWEFKAMIESLGFEY